MEEIEKGRRYRIRLCSGELRRWRFLGEDRGGVRWWRDETPEHAGEESARVEFSESSLMYAWEVLMQEQEEALENSLAGRTLPVGAEVVAGGVHFRLWAPDHGSVDLLLEDASGAQTAHPLVAEDNGYFSRLVTEAGAGALYRYRPGDAGQGFPDPVSRHQPAGPHGPSRVVDARAFAWTDASWGGVTAGNQIIYELHLGTFTRDGTVAAATAELENLVKLGVTVVELMPIADFPGDFGWGYDGVNLFAPCHIYGEPDDYRRFVDRAHALGLAVILDVVYNHLGPDGNYLTAYAKDYMTEKYGNEWGSALNFDGENSAGVREFFISNAVHWIAEYHIDGFRLDATQQIFDASDRHVIAEIAAAARRAAGGRRTLIVAENETQRVCHLTSAEEGGYDLDGVWNDDLHHALRVRLTGQSEAYYSDYRGSVQELLSALKWGYLYQGQRYAWQKQRRGTPTFGIQASRFVTFLENHDQVSNSATGQRLAALVAPDLLRTATALLLLGPGTPMLFQGQEFGSSAPFVYFADHPGELGGKVTQGRREFLAQFPRYEAGGRPFIADDPTQKATFLACKLDLSERQSRAPLYALHRDLIRLRREDPVLKELAAINVDGAVLSEDAFLLRYFAADGADRLLIVNFGGDWHPESVPEPLLAPPLGMRWRAIWSSEDPAYGGSGVPECESADGRWFFQGHATSFLAAEKEGA